MTQPLNFRDPTALTKSLEGIDYLLSTYWVRFDNFGGQNRQNAIDNVKIIVDCAKKAGVKKIIYTSHTQTSLDSKIPYIQGKAQVEQYIKESGLRHAFVKPCAIFGKTPQESILMNNITFLVRYCPIFVLPGDGNYPLQPVHVEDMARIIVECMDYDQEDHDIDAVGPEKFPVRELIETTSGIIGKYCKVITGIDKELCFKLTKPFDWITGDKFIEDQDLDIMLNGLTQSHKPPTGKIRYTDWLKQNKSEMGKKWMSSVSRYYDKKR